MGRRRVVALGGDPVSLRGDARTLILCGAVLGAQPRLLVPDGLLGGGGGLGEHRLQGGGIRVADRLDGRAEALGQVPHRGLVQHVGVVRRPARQCGLRVGPGRGHRVGGGLLGLLGGGHRPQGPVEREPGQVAGVLRPAVRVQRGPYRADGFQPGGHPGAGAFGESRGVGVGGLPADPGRGGVIGELGRGAGHHRRQVGEYRRGLLRVAAGPGGRRPAPGEFRGGLGGVLLVGPDEPFQVGELFDGLVGAAGLELVEPGTPADQGVVRRLPAGLRLSLLRFGAGQGGDIAGELGAPLRAGLAPAGERVGRRPGVGAQVGGIGSEEGAGSLVGGRQPLQRGRDRLHVVERAGRLGDQVVVDRTQPVGERVRQLHRVEVLGQLRPPQRQDQGEQLLVTLPAEAEQPLVDGGPVLGGGGVQAGLPDLLGELLPGHRPVVAGDQREVFTDPAVGDEVPAGRGVAVPGGVQADADGDGLAGVAMSQLQPGVADRILPAAEQQVGLHGPVLGRERVQPLRVDPAVQHEREQNLKGLGLPGAVRAAQDQPAAGEAELLVPVVPHVDDPGPGRFEASHREPSFAAGGSLMCAVILR